MLLLRLINCIEVIKLPYVLWEDSDQSHWRFIVTRKIIDNTMQMLFRHEGVRSRYETICYIPEGGHLATRGGYFTGGILWPLLNSHLWRAQYHVREVTEPRRVGLVGGVFQSSISESSEPRRLVSGVTQSCISESSESKLSSYQGYKEGLYLQKLEVFREDIPRAA